MCAGSVLEVAREIAGEAADTLERLQGTYENDPGFLAVVWDGRNAVTIVQADQLLVWQGRLAPLGIAVAPSCIDPALMDLVNASVPRIAEQQDSIISAGYDALNDAIVVVGVELDVLLAALDGVQPGASAAALAAIAGGTLRVDAAKSSGAEAELARTAGVGQT